MNRSWVGRSHVKNEKKREGWNKIVQKSNAPLRYPNAMG